MRAKIKTVNIQSGIIKATHRDPNWNNRKFDFFVERSEKKCNVRMVMSDGCLDTNYVWQQRDKIWDTFLTKLFNLFPDIDFGVTLSEGRPYIVGAIFLDDGIEQIHISKTKNNPSITGFIVGGLLFGSAGATVGGLSGASKTTGHSYNQLSSSRLVRLIYNNGRVWEGSIDTHSGLYNEIMVNFEAFSNR